MRVVKGFTLVEVLVTIAILGIVTMIAMPNLTSFITKMRVDNEIAELQRFLLATRNSAVNSGEPVTLCPLNGNDCSTNWDGKITLFIDVDGDGSFDATDNDEVLSVKDAIRADDVLDFDKTRITYQPTGLATGFNDTFNYCPSNASELSRSITIAPSGRVYTSKDFDNDGKDENRSGVEASCS